MQFLLTLYETFEIWKKIVQMSLKLGSKMYLMANNVEKEMHPRQWGKIS